jgi:imidazolonepropionase-like amidohydrolase
MNTLLKNVNVIPMQREVVLRSRDVLIENGRITWIGHDSDPQLTSPSGGRRRPVLDCSGKYLLPGLFDMHVHIASSDMFNLFLANGVTAVRNMWGFPRILEWAHEVETGKRIGPSIYSTSALIDGLESWVGAEIVKTTEEAEAAFRRAFAQGYRQIKTYPDIPREAYFRLASLARQYNLQVVGHANRNLSIDELIASGYHTLEHASILPTAGEDVIKVARAGMWNVPTMVVVRAIGDYGRDHKPLSECPYYAYVNANERRDWQGIIDVMRQAGRFSRFNAGECVDRVRLFLEYSDRLLMGTDNGNPGVVAGFSLLDELESSVSDFALSAYQVLRMATFNCAEYFGIADRTGSVQEGKDADLLLLDANPLEDISNVRKLSAVIKKGVIYERPKLDAMLEGVRNMKVEDIEFVGDNAINPPDKR